MTKIVVTTGRGKPITYEADFDVEVGDIVILPHLPWQPDHVTNDAEVVSLESDYDGVCKRALGKYPPLEETQDCGCIRRQGLTGTWRTRIRCGEHVSGSVEG